jgi:membrane protein required for colicin V production
MYWLDTVILGVLALGGLWGMFAGFLWQLSRIMTVALAAYCTILCNERATTLVQQHLLPEAPALVCQVTAYILVFLLVALAMFLLTTLLHRLILKVELQWLNRVLGTLFGVAKTGLIVGLILYGLAGIPGPEEAIGQSRLAQPLVAAVKLAANLLPSAYRDQLGQQLDRVKPLPKSVLNPDMKGVHEGKR